MRLVDNPLIGPLLTVGAAGGGTGTATGVVSSFNSLGTSEVEVSRTVSNFQSGGSAVSSPL